MEVGTIIGKFAFGKVLRELNKRSGEAITKNFDLRKFCQDLNIPLGLKDDIKVLYVQTLIQLADSTEEYKEWIELFIIESVFNAFIEGQKIDKKEIFERELNCQLHTSYIHKLKSFNSVPTYILEDFYSTYSNLISRAETPIQKKGSIERKEISDKVQQLIEDKTNKEVRISVGQIIQDFNSASFRLAEAPNTFNDLPGSHIERQETIDLINWIEEDQEPAEERNPIALLVGNAGTGKTTILKDLLLKLQKDKIPVLGIKADRFYAESRKQLEEKLNIENKLIRSFESILEEEGKLVVIIDQIDALSQSLSARREYLDTINQLVRDASRLIGIRIIISIRTFDLTYDDDFRFYKNQKELKVANLTKPQIEDVLKKIEFPLSQLSEILLDLLKIPLHLNVFCKVYDKGRSYQNIKTLNDLYGELWQEKIVKIRADYKTNPKRCKKLLFKLAKKMNDGQWITLSSAKYKDSFINELNYLQSVGLISLNSDEIQFFHQTFYDFCFAKRFVEKNQSLSEFILEKNQSLFVRSAVKMILDFQRSYDHVAYIENYKQIFTSVDYRFHIKLLLINLLGFIEKPTEKETIFVSEILLKKAESCYVFIESAFTSEWFKFLYESSRVFEDIFNIQEENELFEIVQTEQKMDFHNFWYQFFRKYNVFYKSEILTIINQQPESDIKYKLASNYLFIVQDWSDQIAFNLFEQCKSRLLFDEFDIYNILGDICFHKFEFATKEYLEIIEEKIRTSLKKKKIKVSGFESLLDTFKGIPELTDKDESLFEKMCEADSESFFEFGIMLCTRLIVSKKNNYYKEVYPSYGCIIDSAFDNFCFDDIEDNCHNQNILFKNTAIAIQKLAKEENIAFNKYLDENIDTKYISILKLIIFGLCENPKYYEDKIILLIKNIDSKNGFIVDRDFLLYIRELIKRSYSSLSKNNQEYIVRFLCDFDKNYKIEIDKKIKPEDKFWYFRYFEKEKFLFFTYLSENERNQYPILKRTFQELVRKYSKPPKEDRGKIVGCAIGPPIGLSNCFKFTLTDWKKSINKYNTNNHYEFINGIGGLEEHAKQFSTVVSKFPKKFVDFIEKLIDENTVPHEYMIYGVHGLMNGKIDQKRYQILFEKIIKIDVSPYNFSSIVSLTDYFIENKQLPEVVKTFLVNAAIKDRELSNTRNGENYTSNALHVGKSSAIYRLTSLSFAKQYKSEIFEALELIAIQKNNELLEALVSGLIKLLDLDHERTLNVFLLATENFSKRVAMKSVVCLKRLSELNFSSVVNVLNDGMKHEAILTYIAEIIGFAWIASEPGSEELLEIIVNKGEKAKSTIVRIAIDNINSSDVSIANRSIELFKRFLDSNDVAVADEYSNAFRIMEKERFNTILPYLRLYSKSYVAEKSPYGLLRYLSKCATKHPKECIDVVANFYSWDLRERIVGRNSPVNVVVSAINSLDGITVKERKDNDYIEKGVELFDRMLEDSRIRSSADKALEIIN